MAKSRITGVLLSLALIATPTVAQEPPADKAIDQYRRMLPPVGELDCPRGTANEVVVCGRRSDDKGPYRLPLPAERSEGERVVGETMTPAQVAGKRETCSTIGPAQSCGGGLPILAIIGFAAKVMIEGAKRLADPDE